VIRDDRPWTDGGEAAETVFSLAGDETRAGILRVLGRSPGSRRRSPSNERLSTPRWTVGSSPATSGGWSASSSHRPYRLRNRGATLYRTLRSGTFTRSSDVAAYDAGFDCRSCDGRPEGRYGHGTFELECPDCGHAYVHSTAPPSTVEGDPTTESVLDRLNN
jgi:hypothetical protein